MSEIFPNGNFFEEHRDNLENLFQTLGHGTDWTGTISGAVAFTQANWVRGDHHSPENKEVFTSNQEEKARSVFDALGLVSEIPPPSGAYDEIVLLAGMTRANNLRTSFLADTLSRKSVTINPGGKIVTFTGPRRSEALETQPIVDLHDKVSSAALTDSWLRIRQEEHNSGTDLLDVYATEIESERLALIAHFGGFALSRMDLKILSGTDMTNDELARDVRLSYTLRNDNLNVPLVMLNATTVARPIGPSRHTTEQCTFEWLEQVPPKKDARVLFVTSNPYTRRTTKVVHDVLQKMGRDDVEFYGCGPAAYENMKMQVFMGEVARLLYEDQRASE